MGWRGSCNTLPATKINLRKKSLQKNQKKKKSVRISELKNKKTEEKMKKTKRRLKTVSFFLFLIFTISGIYASEWISFDGTTTQAPPIITVLSSDNTSTVINIHISGALMDEKVVDDTTYHLLKFKDYATRQDVGKPALPAIHDLVGIPASAAVTITVQDSSIFQGYSGYKIYPYQESKNSPADTFYIDTEFYETDNFYPADKVDVGAPAILRDVRVGKFSLYPMIYNPVQDSLIVYYDITIRLDYSGRDSRNVLVNSRNNVSPAFDDLYQNSIVNYDFLNHTRNELANGYLIITPTEYADMIQPLADWKIQKGIPTEIVIISPDCETTDVKDIIIQHYNSDNIEYVLLVGNEIDIPLYEDYIHYVQYNDPSGSDYWYSLISGDDDYADLFIGRLSAENLANVTTQVNKILDYELSPQNVTSMLLIADDEEPPFPSHPSMDYPFQTSIERAEDILEDYNMNVITCYGAAAPQGDGADNQTIFDNFGSVGIVNYCGHGSGWFPPVATSNNNCWIDWAENDDFTINDASSLENTSYPIVLSISCWNGIIDADEDRISLAEAFLWNENGGASGCLASTRSAMFASSYDFEQKLFKGAFFNDYNEIGLNIEWSKNNIINQWGEIGLSDARCFHWFGDPQMSIYTDTPQEFIVAYSDSLIISPGTKQVTITVTDEDDDFVEGAVVCLYKDSEMYYRGLTTTYGQASFTLDVLDSSEGRLKVTVTKDNFIPNIGEIEIHFPPLAPENLYIVNDEPNLILSWTPVNEDIVGNSEIITNYRIYRNHSDPYFIPTLSDLLSTAIDTTFTDWGVMYNYSKAFYKVSAVSFLPESERKSEGKNYSISESENLTRKIKLESSPISKSFNKTSHLKKQN